MFSLVHTNPVARHIVRYAQIVLGALLTSLGYNLFLIPAHLLTGGISGIAIVIYYLTGLPVGAQNFVYNLPILYLAYRMFGRHYAFDTIFGTVVLSILLDLTHFVVDWNVCANIVLNSVFGGVLTGIGFGMVFRVNANTGGLDVVGAVVKKYYAIDMGTVVFVLNFLIVAGSAFVCTLEEMLFTFISIYVIAELTNRVAAGLNREKSIVIISGEAEKICTDIMENVHRGVTYLDGRGGLTKEPRGILFAVVSLTQVGRVKTIVRHHDPQAFMIVSDTSEVTGKGFTLECESYADAKRKWEEQKARQR
ncbi:YitT family protein [Selenomonas bovis]|uniref:YitT family protein n=1 Tax=Selenomonas bovis TaxID=416586 RepID=A0A848BBE3_9FIRM|nr:YitT family protein [Selenomonas bovis]NMD98371.1 YitT family protein [Selenomonas bovis]